MSARGADKDIKKKSKKKTPFWKFFIKRERELEKEENAENVAGAECVSTVQDRRSELMAIIGREWDEMTLEEREPYGIQAQKNSKSDDGAVFYNSFGMTQAAIHQAHQNQELALRDKSEYMLQIVEYYKEKGELAEMPIVLCQFGTYARKVVNQVMHVLPSEVALVGFSMRRGIFCNFAMLIDPGEHDQNDFSRDEVKENCEKLELFINYDKKLQDYQSTLQTIDDFLLQAVKAKVLFCNKDELDVTTACLQWLCDRAGGDGSEYEVLSLPHLILKYAIEARKIALTMDQTASISEEVKDGLDLKQQLVGGLVAYPHEYPWIESQGIFGEIAHVQALLDRSNYTYYHELSCSYHMEVVDGCQFCPLSIANRYAFVLMDVLLRHFPDVIPIYGKHYPRVNDLPKEGMERRKMLRQWTQFHFITLAHRFMEGKEDAKLQRRQLDRNLERARILAGKAGKFTETRL